MNIKRKKGIKSEDLKKIKKHQTNRKRKGGVKKKERKGLKDKNNNEKKDEVK